jgi:hypothetical protein
MIRGGEKRMKEVNWQVLDKDQIIDIIIKHNASIDTLNADMARRVRNKLNAMNAVELWRHIKTVYDNKLYEPDIMTVDPMERRIQEKEYNKRLTHEKQPVLQPLKKVLPTVTVSMREEAFNDIYGKACVKNAFDYGSGSIIVIMKDMSMIERLRKWVSKHYPMIDVEIIGEAK